MKRVLLIATLLFALISCGGAKAVSGNPHLSLIDDNTVVDNRTKVVYYSYYVYAGRGLSPMYCDDGTIMTLDKYKKLKP